MHASTRCAPYVRPFSIVPPEGLDLKSKIGLRRGLEQCAKQPGRLRHRLRDSSTDAYAAGDKIYTAVLPPSTGRIAPWMKLARSVARNTIASAVSSGSAGRPAGACAASCCSASPIAAVPSVRVGPGLTAFTRTPLGPYSAAQALVNRLIAALLDP